MCHLFFGAILLPTVAQISDLHLSPRVPARQVQVEPILQAINDAKPDLVVISGDLTDDGWERPEDFVWAKQWVDERIDGEWFAVPGNHDVGNFAGAKEGAITAERVEAWVQVFGSHYSSLHNFPPGADVQGWMLMGCNSMLFGSGLSHEQQQMEWVKKQLAGAHKYNYVPAFFLHSPLFTDRTRDETTPAVKYWLGSSRSRNDLISTANFSDTRLIASGHVHQTKFDTIGGDKKGVGSRFFSNDNDTPTRPQKNDSRPLFQGTNIVWAPPASGTWVHAPGLPNPPAPEQTGFVLHHLGDDGSVRSEVIECAPMLKTVEFDPLAE